MRRGIKKFMENGGETPAAATLSVKRSIFEKALGRTEVKESLAPRARKEALSIVIPAENAVGNAPET
jgi:hypothetical protein